MMKQLLRNLNDLVDTELALANRDNGSTFHSNHEAWAVMLEEIDEANEAMLAVRDRGKRISTLQNNIEYAASRLAKAEVDHKRVWRKNVRSNSIIQDHDFEVMERFAIDAAAELIQVAAMCRKWKQSQDEWKRRVEAKLP